MNVIYTDPIIWDVQNVIPTCGVCRVAQTNPVSVYSWIPAPPNYAGNNQRLGYIYIYIHTHNMIQGCFGNVSVKWKKLS